MMIRNTLCMATLCAAAVVSAPAWSVDTIRTEAYNAPAHCQGALPNFEGHIRKRPLALQNEGTSPAFVTCALPQNGRLERVTVYASSYSGKALVVSCTAVTGHSDSPNDYVVKTVTAPADGFGTHLVWRPIDFAAGPTISGGLIGLSCNLPPGAALTHFWLTYLEGIGAI